MRNIYNGLLVAALLLFASAAQAALELGKDYKLLNPPQPASTKKIEVLEFFSYGCSHCFHLQSSVGEWEKTMPKDVELHYVPTIFSSSAEPFARTYFALESMKQLPKMHEAVYKAIHQDNIELFDFAGIANFVVKRGLNREEFSAAYNSFSVQNDVERVKQMIRTYGINGTPALIVDGKYQISGLQPAEMIRVLKEVIEMARKQHRAPAKAR